MKCHVLVVTLPRNSHTTLLPASVNPLEHYVFSCTVWCFPAEDEKETKSSPASLSAVLSLSGFIKSPKFINIR